MTSEQDFHPRWASPPGETIIDALRDRGLDQGDLAERIGCSLGAVEDLLKGRATITIRLARLLSEALGASVEFWMARDYQYREDARRLRTSDQEWLKALPLGDLVRFRWLDPPPHPSEELASCLEFFDVSSVDAWHEKYASLQAQVSFRTSPAFDSNPAAVAAWLRKGEIEAEAIICSPWDPKRFRESLVQARELTRIKNPNRFVPALQKVCAESGVAVAVVRAPAGCRASGATRFLSKDKALLLLSFRYLTDDHFWFTFFHEAGHLLLHGKGRVFIEGEGTPPSQEEEEANDFAADALVPAEFQAAMRSLPVSHRAVIRFARRIGISPGVVVGQLQHSGRVKRSHLNRLKRRFKWEP